MRLVKIMLIFLLVVVTALYGMTMFTKGLDSSKDAPTISCPSDTISLSVNDDESVLLTGITAADKQDGDLTGELRISGISKFLEIGTASVTYLVFDSDHNVATCTRTLQYTDYESPRFEITAPLNYKSSEDIELLDRIRVIDCIDGDITASVRTSSLSSDTAEQTYIAALQVTNSMGDSAEITLPIVWYSNNSDRPQIVLSDYLVYLSQGSSFRASDYVAYVKTADGTVNKSAVKSEGDVDTSTPGTYYVRYTYTYAVTETQTLDGIAILTVVVE